MPDVELRGCRTQPLMSYLKALGVFRAVGRVDRAARLSWDRAGHAVLRSGWSEDELISWFIDAFQPSAITSPWNGGSGYHPKDFRDAIVAIERSDSPRLETLRRVIAAGRRAVGRDGHLDKSVFLERWRAECPDEALPWLDATMVLGDEGPRMNPLLGTGGNDGRLDFSNNYLQRLVDALPGLFGGGATGAARARQQLEGALYERSEVPLSAKAVGMFNPSAAGLPNSSSATGDASLVNPWDFVLMLEGALLFGGAAARRLDAEQAVFPFTVTGSNVTRIGRSLATGADAKTRGETWLPIWERPVALGALSRMLAEGRTQDGLEQARSGRAVARAVGGRGVDPGISAFERVVYAERFGRSYVAVPVGTARVRGRADVALLRGADRWLAAARRSGGTAPLRHSLGAVDRAAFDLTSSSDERAALERWLLALAGLELVVARRPAARDSSSSAPVRPLYGMDPRIVERLDDGTPEYRLARALAVALTLRELLEPVSVEPHGRAAWRADGRAVASVQRPLELLSVAGVALRGQPSAGWSRRGASVEDVQRFVDGRLDDQRVAILGFAFSLCRPAEPVTAPVGETAVDRLYAVAHLATAGAARRPGSKPTSDGQGTAEPAPVPEIVRMLARGRGEAAARRAVGVLRARDLAPYRSLGDPARTPQETGRIAAALAFPVHTSQRSRIERLVLHPLDQDRSGS